MSHSVEIKPTLECIMEDIDYDSIDHTQKISLTPYYKNLNMASLIENLLYSIENTINNFVISYKKYRQFIINEYVEEMMEEVNKNFEKIYKLIHLTYDQPQSAFRVDNKVYQTIFKDSYLDDEFGENFTTMESIYQELLEIEITIQTYTFEIESYFERRK